MSRYQKKVAQPPMGTPPPRPGGGAPPPPAPGGPAPMGGPGAAPPGPRPGLERPPEAPPGGEMNPDPLKPRTPPTPPGPTPPGPGGPGMGNVPTDVHVDAATGNVNISKGPVTIRVAKYDADNPPDKVRHLPEKAQRQWVHVYNSAADEGDDEETAHKKAWGTVPDKGKGEKDSMKTADVSDGTNSPWDEFNSGNVPDLDDSKDELFYDTHDDPYAAARNRRAPKTVSIVANVASDREAKSLAFALQLYTSLDVVAEGSKVTINNVQHPVGLLSEIKAQGIDAEVVGGTGQLTKNFGYLNGQKVAMIGDFPDMNYYPNDQTRLVEAQIIGRQKDGKFILKNDMWGVFTAESHEIEEK